MVCWKIYGKSRLIVWMEVGFATRKDDTAGNDGYKKIIKKNNMLYIY